MIVTLRFDTDNEDQKYELEEIQAVKKMSRAISFFFETARDVRKYRENVSEEVYKIIDELHEGIRNELEGYDVW